MPRGAPENMKPVTERTKDEAKNLSSRGGRASGIKRRKLKAAKEYMRLLMGLPLNKSQKSMAKYLSDAGVPEADHNQLSLMLVALTQKAQKGDVKCAELVLALMGEKPSDKLEVGGTLTVAGVMAELRERQERVKREQDDG